MKRPRTTVELEIAVVELLRRHSVDKPIYCKEAASELGIGKVRFRELVRALTIKGNPIGADTKEGFYWATLPEHMTPKINQLRRRIVGVAQHLKGAKKAKRMLERSRAVPRDETYQLEFEAI